MHYLRLLAFVWQLISTVSHKLSPSRIPSILFCLRLLEICLPHCLSLKLNSSLMHMTHKFIHTTLSIGESIISFLFFESIALFRLYHLFYLLASNSLTHFSMTIALLMAINLRCVSQIKWTNIHGHCLELHHPFSYCPCLSFLQSISFLDYCLDFLHESQYNWLL